MDLVERGSMLLWLWHWYPWYSADILPALVSTIFADKLDGALAIVAALFGGGILNLVFGLLFAFIGIAIYSAIFSWVANKFDANTTYESVLKIMWYETSL